MYGSICITESDIQIILNRYKCINRYRIDVTYFNIYIHVWVDESVFLMDLLRGIDLRIELKDLENMVPVSIKLESIVYYE